MVIAHQLPFTSYQLPIKRLPVKNKLLKKIQPGRPSVSPLTGRTLLVPGKITAQNHSRYFSTNPRKFLQLFTKFVLSPDSRIFCSYFRAYKRVYKRLSLCLPLKFIWGLSFLRLRPKRDGPISNLVSVPFGLTKDRPALCISTDEIPYHSLRHTIFVRPFPEPQTAHGSCARRTYSPSRCIRRRISPSLDSSSASGPSLSALSPGQPR